jgi:rhamnosyltransferase subunit B
MQALLATTGSMGDFLPFVGLGRELRARGHEVVLLAGGGYERFAQEAGICFDPLYSAAEHERMFAKTWTGFASVGNWLDHVAELVEPVFSRMCDRHVPGETVVVNLDWLFGARIAGETLGCPVATVHMQPSTLCSPRELFPDLPRRLAAGLVRFGQWYIGKQVGGAVQQLRGRYGLPPVSRLLDWWNSPDLVIGFFPDWFAPPQPEWPANVLLPGFALYETDPSVVLPERLVSFLSAGTPPIVFGHGSYMSNMDSYFRQSIEAARQLGCRAILLTPRPEQIPGPLPDGIAGFSFVPHRLLLPHAAAFVHHGGTGSMAAGLAAGVPQLLVPSTGDQPDNARRLQALGVSDTLPVTRYRTDRVAEKLSRLLASTAVRERCREYMGRVQGASFARVADALERCLSMRSGGAVSGEAMGSVRQ